MKRKGTFRQLQSLPLAPVVIGGAALLTLDVARRVFRRMQLFSPSMLPVLSWRPEDYGIARERVEDLWFETDDGEILNGWYCRAENPVASALYFHGNTGNLTNVAHVLPHLLESGINILIFDYRGFGLSSGSPSLGGIVSDGVCAARLHERIRPKSIPSVIYGYSLGGAIAAQVIRHHSFDGMILQSTFTNLPAMARVTFPRVPIHLIAGKLFDTMTVVRKLEVPLLIIHGSDDEVCPSWMAKSLHESCGSGTKRLLFIDGGLHKDLFIRDANSLVGGINRFASELTANPQVIEHTPPFTERMLDAVLRVVRRQIRRRPVQQTL